MAVPLAAWGLVLAVSENGSGFLDWGLGEGLPLNFQGWGAGPLGWEAGVLGPWLGSATDSQCDLPSVSPNVQRWREHPRMLTRGRPVRQGGEDREASGFGVPQTWAPLCPVPWVEPP